MIEKRICFIGGIHGVGKGKICNSIAGNLNLATLSASSILKWSEVSTSIENKVVLDIGFTQDRLINGVNALEPDNYLIDGHFCLFDEQFNVRPIEIETFEKMNLSHLAVLLGDPARIAERLFERDNKVYNIELLNRMQTTELTHAKLVSTNLSIPLAIIRNDNIQDYLNELSKIIKK